MKTEEQLNVDYILTLERERDSFGIHKRQIMRSKKEEEILRCLPEVKNVSDVLQLFESIKSNRLYSYCWPYRYSTYGVRKYLPNEILDLEPNRIEEYKDILKRYLYAQCYNNMISQIKNNVLMYSSDIVGWYEPQYVINDEVSISLKTNFCYGQSSYFYVILCYKGIEIIAYSDIVKYHWSRMMDFVRYTADFEPERYNWENALVFVKNISELILRDNKRFEQEWILDQVEGMMNGLKQINDNVEEYYNNQRLKFEKEKNDDTKVYLYRNINQDEIDCYNIYPNEYLLTTRVDKLSTALGFLKDLTALTQIYHPITQHIKTILRYNEELLSPIKKCIDDVRNHLMVLYPQRKLIAYECDELEKKLQWWENEIKEDLRNAKFCKKVLLDNEVKNRCAQDDIYAKIKEELEKKKEDFLGMYELIRKRERFLKHLEEREQFILDKLKEYCNN